MIDILGPPPLTPNKTKTTKRTIWVYRGKYHKQCLMWRPFHLLVGDTIVVHVLNDFSSLQLVAVFFCHFSRTFVHKFCCFFNVKCRLTCTTNRAWTQTRITHSGRQIIFLKNCVKIDLLTIYSNKISKTRLQSTANGLSADKTQDIQNLNKLRLTIQCFVQLISFC